MNLAQSLVSNCQNKYVPDYHIMFMFSKVFSVVRNRNTVKSIYIIAGRELIRKPSINEKKIGLCIQPAKQVRNFKSIREK